MSSVVNELTKAVTEAIQGLRTENSACLSTLASEIQKLSSIYVCNKASGHPPTDKSSKSPLPSKTHANEESTSVSHPYKAYTHSTLSKTISDSSPDTSESSNFSNFSFASADEFGEDHAQPSKN